MAKIDIDLKNYSDALERVNIGRDMFNEIGSKKGLINSLDIISECYVATKDYNTALTYIEEAPKINKVINSQNGIGVCLSNKAIILQETNKLKESIELRMQALEIFEAAGYSNNLANELKNYGCAIYKYLNDYNRAVYCLIRSLAISKKLKLPVADKVIADLNILKREVPNFSIIFKNAMQKVESELVRILIKVCFLHSEIYEE